MAANAGETGEVDRRDKVVTIDISQFSYGGSPAAIYRLKALTVAFLGAALIVGGLLISAVLSTDVVLGLPIVLALPFLAVLIVLALWPIYSDLPWNVGGLGELPSERDFRWFDLDRIVPLTGVTLRTLLERTRAFAASQGSWARIRNPAKRTDVWAARAMSLLVILAGMLLMYFFSDNKPVAILASIVMIAGGHLLASARNESLPDVDFLLAHDRRKPTLLLRSFRDDEIKCREIRRPLPGLPNLGTRRFEQGIAGTLHAFGPLVAVGAPGEAIPKIGAARTYLREDLWQDAVARFIGAALLIVMIAGDTQWIKWELHRIVEMGRLRHLLILMPPDVGERRRERWSNVLASFAQTAWYDALATMDIDQLLLIQLRPDGALVAIRSGGSLVDDYRLAILIAIFGEFANADSNPTQGGR